MILLIGMPVKKSMQIKHHMIVMIIKLVGCWTLAILDISMTCGGLRDALANPIETNPICTVIYPYLADGDTNVYCL